MNETWGWLLVVGLLIAGLAFVASTAGSLPQPTFLAPVPGTEVGLPARVVIGGLPQGGEIGVRLLDSYGRVLAEDAARESGGKATLELYYDLPASPRGRLEAFMPIPGLDRKALATREVRFADVPYAWAKPYFLDLEGNPFPLIRRVPQTAAVATQALRILLRGPTWRERVRGYWTALPPGVELVDLSISSGVAEVRLRGGIGHLAPELRALALVQIEKTLQEFPTVSRVRVYADGEYLGP